MVDFSEGDSSSLQVVLERVDPARNIARYYVLSVEQTLFAKHTLIRRWGRIGCLVSKPGAPSVLQERGCVTSPSNAGNVAHTKAQTRLCAKERTGMPCPTFPRQRIQLK
jgi:VanZ family protein